MGWRWSKKRCFQLASKCPFCGKDVESLEHILIHCPLIWDLWTVIFSTFDVVGARPFVVRDFLNTWVNFPVRKNLRISWRAVPLCLFLGYLKERNIVVFEDSPFSLSRLKLSFSSFLASWAGLILNIDLTVVRILLCIIIAIDRS